MLPIMQNAVRLYESGVMETSSLFKASLTVVRCPTQDVQSTTPTPQLQE
jgi:hypothetical protein